MRYGLYPENINLFKFNNKNTKERCGRCVNDIDLVSLLITLNTFPNFYSVSGVDFEHVNVCWICSFFPRRFFFFIKYHSEVCHSIPETFNHIS